MSPHEQSASAEHAFNRGRIDRGTMASKPFVTQSLQDGGAWYFAWYYTLAYSVLENFRDLNFRGRGQGQGLENWSSIDLRGQGLSSRTTTLLYRLYTNNNHPPATDGFVHYLQKCNSSVSYFNINGSGSTSRNGLLNLQSDVCLFSGVETVGSGGSMNQCP